PSRTSCLPSVPRTPRTRSCSAWPLAFSMISRRRFLGGAAGAWLVLGPAGLAAQEGVFLKPEEAPRHLFPEATSVTERTEVATPVMQHKIRDLLGRPPEPVGAGVPHLHGHV